MKKRGFTLAEVLITLAIIGVVAAISIPSVISNSQQQEFKTGLRKAVSVLNSAITMNMAIDGESPYDNANLFGYLQRHMNVMKSYDGIHNLGIFYHYVSKSYDGIHNLGIFYHYVSHTGKTYTGTNSGFYTTDGMRFEHLSSNSDAQSGPLLHESNIRACVNDRKNNICGGCGSYGLAANPNKTTKPPCAIMVDVNGDRKPYPTNVDCKNDTCAKQNILKVPLPTDKKVNDIFTILITEDRAIPYGVVAQKAMYQAQK